jgi:hypothetical protein
MTEVGRVFVVGHEDWIQNLLKIWYFLEKISGDASLAGRPLFQVLCHNPYLAMQ